MVITDTKAGDFYNGNNRYKIRGLLQWQYQIQGQKDVYSDNVMYRVRVTSTVAIKYTKSEVLLQW